MEDVISFEVAKLCEEKGIFIHSLSFYDLENKDLHNNRVGKLLSYDCSSLNPAYYKRIEIIAAPTQSVLQRWLREKYDIHIIVVSSNIEGYNYGVVKEKGFLGISPNIFPFETYEEALEQSLLEALQMI